MLTAPESFGELAHYAVNNAWIELDAYDAVHATFTVITLSVAVYLSFQAYRASNSKNENNVARVVAWVAILIFGTMWVLAIPLMIAFSSI